MINADLTSADLSETLLVYADFTYTFFDPFYVENIRGMELARGLTKVRFAFRPTALVLVRDDFRKRGAHQQARELTYAVRRTQRLHDWEQWETAVDAAFNYLAFELTCAYGLYHGRPLRILGVLIPLFGLVYMAALLYPGHRGGIWRVWGPDRIMKHEGQTAPERLSASLDSSRGRRGIGGSVGRFG